MTSHAFYDKILTSSSGNNKGSHTDEVGEPEMPARVGGKPPSPLSVASPAPVNTAPNFMDFDDLLSAPPPVAEQGRGAGWEAPQHGLPPPAQLGQLALAGAPAALTSTSASAAAAAAVVDPFDELVTLGRPNVASPATTDPQTQGSAPTPGSEFDDLLARSWPSAQASAPSHTAGMEHQPHLPNRPQHSRHHPHHPHHQHSQQHQQHQQHNHHPQPSPGTTTDVPWGEFDPFSDLTTKRIPAEPSAGTGLSPRAATEGLVAGSHGNHQIADLLGDGELFSAPPMQAGAGLVAQHCPQPSSSAPSALPDASGWGAGGVQSKPSQTAAREGVVSRTSTGTGRSSSFAEAAELGPSDSRGTLFGAAGGEQRELKIFGIPLCSDRLVFLAVPMWKVGNDAESPQGLVGTLNNWRDKFSESVSSLWNGMKEKDPDSFQNKVYRTGTEIMENMSAEERLMTAIPAGATKVVVHFPSTTDAADVQEVLTKMVSSYAVKSAGKATVAGLALPVAVGAEMLMVPGVGWFAAYQLYKNSVSAAGGQRLNAYINKGGARVCYAADPRLDIYAGRSKSSPDGLLTDDDIEELCVELECDGGSSLTHGLMELRARYIRRLNGNDAQEGYNTLAADEADMDSDDECGAKISTQKSRR